MTIDTGLSLDELDRHHLRVQLSEAQCFESDPETLAADGTKWVRMGSPLYSIDRDSHTAIVASMITRPKSIPSKRNGGDRRPHDHEILFYNLPDLTNPIARCDSDVWEKDKKTGTQAQPWYHPFTHDMMQVVQVVEIKHYPETVVLGNMRVVVVIAFGQRARPGVNNTTDSHILGVWLMLKVIEVWVPAHPQAIVTKSMMNHFCVDPLGNMPIRKCVRINPDDVINIETLEPRQSQITMHGRIVKLYSAYEPPVTGCLKLEGMKKVDCIAIFGIQNSDMACAMVIKKVLFRDGPDHADLGKKTYYNKTVSRGVRCMTLFPDHSGYEHLLVLFNQHGRGMVWDWVREKQITQLHMTVDSKNDETRNGIPPPRKKLYYWGVQVSAAFADDTFRIVTMADGDDDAWESCWWNLTADLLQEPTVALPAPPIIDRTKPAPAPSHSTIEKPPVIASVKWVERKTYGVCLPEQLKTHAAENNQPIQFIAYVIWNHYRIGLSSRMGIVMVDLEEPQSDRVADRQWITFLKDRDREDLIDIAVVDHNLIVTLKTGHLVWSFDGMKHCKDEK